MLTDEQLELAARKYCELAGMDPDKMVPHGAEPSPEGFIPMVLLHSPCWQLVAKILRDTERQLHAIEIAKHITKEPQL